MNKPINRTTRQKVEEYKGLLIIREIWEHQHGWHNVETSISYFLCKPDETTPKPWNRATNRLHTWARTIENIKKVADDILSGAKVAYTDADRKKYVSNYNYKHGWGFNKDMLLQTMRMHQNGTPEMKRLMEDRLEDANFHGYCGDLVENNYEKFLKRIEDEIKRGYL